MSFILALAQCTHPADGDVIGMARDWFAAAADCHADLLVFPENLMCPYNEEQARFAKEPESADGPFAQAIDALAAEYGIWTVYTLFERSEAAARPFNTAIVTDAEGVQRGMYRKVHLFDAQGYRESDRLSAGNELFEPIETPFCTLGLAICYDLRFPEIARKAALGGCQLMLFPAAWVSGPDKVRQWKTLLAARAIENGMFVAGVSRADRGYVGNSCIFAPDGSLIAQGASTPWAAIPKGALKSAPVAKAVEPDDESQALIIASIDIDEIEQIRAATPSLSHRRMDCYC